MAVWQPAIGQALREAGADYVLAVKRNHPTLHREVKAAFDNAERGAFWPQAEDRRERRRCTVLGEWGRGPRSLARPAQPGPRAGGTLRPLGPPAALRALLHLQPTRGCRRPADPRARPLGRRERVAPHPGRVVPRGRLPHPHRKRARHHGHPQTSCPEHPAHESTETRNGRVHRVAARPHRTPTLDPGCRTAPSTLRLPWGNHWCCSGVRQSTAAGRRFGPRPTGRQSICRFLLQDCGFGLI